MAYSFMCLGLHRVLIPAVLVLAALLRPVGISFVYLLMFFLSPFIAVPNNRNFKVSVTAYFIILIALSTILLLCHAALTVTIITMEIDSLSGSCSFLEQLLRHVGFIDFRKLTWYTIAQWLGPDVAVFGASLATYILTKKMNAPSRHNSLNDDAETTLPNVISVDRDPDFDTLLNLSPFICLATLFFAGVLRPSVPGGFYFLFFLLSGSYWALFKQLRHKFAVLLRVVMVVLVVHALCLVAYQTPWMQEHLDSKSLIARLTGLEPLMLSNCAGDIRNINYNNTLQFDSFLNPYIVFVAYYCLALTSKNLVHKIFTKPTTALGEQQQLENGSKFSRQSVMAQSSTRASKKDSWSKKQRLNIWSDSSSSASSSSPEFSSTSSSDTPSPTTGRMPPRKKVSLRRQQRPVTTIEPTETTPLVRYAKSVQKDSSPGDIPLDNVVYEESSFTFNATVCDQIWYGFTSIGGFIYQNSYIFTNILMMAWSIIYHSWLTFVLLLWANVLWMIPNQRKAMMRSSPFIVVYAELLLIAQYIYGMDLTNSELPSSVNTSGINLNQIGLERPQEHGMQPCVPLIVKMSFVLMFWVTSRQFFMEKKHKKESTIADMIGPLQLNFSTVSQSSLGGIKTSKFLKMAGDIIKYLLVRLWIWLLVLVIFLCAITGETMTGDRICYMASFLFFLLLFQASAKIWVKVMYGFWLYLIFVAMTILILIYTYQFDKFDEYWSHYLNISKTLQKDMGLQRFKTKDLFLHLASPTIIVILTVIQVHYFHQRFIASLEEPAIISGAVERKTIFTGASARARGSTATGLGTSELIKLSMSRVMLKGRRWLRSFKLIFWQFLELHIIKAVYIAAFVCAVSEVCLLHVALIVLCVVGVVAQNAVQVVVSRIISLIVSIIILAKMIYQVSYLNHNVYNYICQDFNETGNNAEWFGLSKATNENGGLMALLKKYIIYMVVVTIHAIVSLRQFQMRTLTGTLHEPPPKVLFEHITRDDAETDLRDMTKYLFSYGFYKFGFEISLITLVATIAYRQDVVAVVYAGWLAILLLLPRSQCPKIWAIFQIFLVFSILIQYLVLMALPPSLCISYPWLSTRYSNSIQRWTMLPGPLKYHHNDKLIFDFILLLIVHRQKRVFNIESRHDPYYPGGNNSSVVKEISNMASPNFQNPTHDFLSHVRNYLDVFKYGVLCGFFWVTLAVVFLAGTNIGDLLAVGYLVGAFIFLWEGSDYYLRPIDKIIMRWRWLIAYNVSNIVVKTCLQMAGCIFKETLVTKCCWLVHVLGIACASDDPTQGDNDINDSGCPAIATHVVLLWDAICFGFLIFQLRIFKSYYFCHIVVDTKANSILASRGAEIIEQLRQKQIRHQEDQEADVLVKIKRKMERIRATQQKMLRSTDKTTHLDEITPDAEAVVRMAPLAHNSSFSSCQGSGYHTPDDDNSSESSATQPSSESSEDRAQLIDNDDRNKQPIRIECDQQTDYADVNSLSDDRVDMALAENVIRLHLPEIDIQINAQPTTPSSDLTTMPLDGFLEANRLSQGSAPNSDILGQQRDDSDESSEVFSPPPYETVSTRPQPHMLMPPAPTSYSLTVNVSGGSSIISSNLTPNEGANGGRHRRQSSTNAVSWNETVSIKCASKENTPSIEGSDVEVPVTLRQRSLHRRHLSMGNAAYSMDERSTMQDSNRRYSNVSWARAETVMRAKARPHSWGPVDHGIPVSGVRPRKRIKLHPHEAGASLSVSDDEPLRPPHKKAVRAGDYYMFEDVDEKFELDMIGSTPDFLADDDKAVGKLGRRRTLTNVWRDLKHAELRRQIYLRQRSYASAPESSIDLKINEEFDNAPADVGEGGVRTSTHSEPANYGMHRSETDNFLAGKEPQPSTSQAAKAEEAAEAQKKAEPERRSTDSELDKIDEALEANPITRLLEGFMVTMTMFLNRFSRHYRYVNKILAEEKKALKESENIHNLSRGGAKAIFAQIHKRLASEDDEENDTPTSPPPDNINQTSDNETTNNATNTTTTTTNVPMQMPMPIQPSTNASDQTQTSHVVSLNENSPDTIDVINDGSPNSPTSLQAGHRWEGMPQIRIRIPSIDCYRNGSGSLSRQCSYDIIESSKDMVKLKTQDFESRDHNIIIEFFISAWYALLSNTDLICYIVVFINQVVNASLISLPLPIMVFLWGTLSLPRPTKTFWVTMIAYTQANVLIKCIFQYKLIWANYINLPNQPLSPAKILGVEMNPNYAMYDLLLLLVLFFHRFILKLHGLWKSEYREIFVLSEKHKSRSKSSDRGSDKGSDKGSIKSEKVSIKSSASIFTTRQNASDMDLANDIDDNDDNADNASVRTHRDPDAKYKKKLKKLKRTRYFSSLFKFFRNLIKKPRLPTDVYALMFLCDFVNFFVLLFGFTAFGSQQTEGQGEGVQQYLAENKVPIPFLIMLLVQFILIVIDRALYLRKALVYKITFHFLSVIGIHIWMFFIVPAVTERSFYSLAPPIIFYIIKCFYMLLSSYQIKCGYPKRILGNFLTKSFSLVNMISFKVYMLIPFLYELRTILDWVCTDTTMTLFDWLKMEDIFSDIYFIKCSRQLETDFPAIRAVKKPLLTKLLLGGTIILVIVVSIWGPLCLFALGNAVGQSNPPAEVRVSIRIGSYDPIYKTQNRENIFQFDSNMYATLERPFLDKGERASNVDKAALTFISGYDPEDVAAIVLAGNSPSLWTISPPDKERLLQELHNGSTLATRFTYSIGRIPPAKGLVGVVNSEVVHELDENFEGREAMIAMLEGRPTTDVIVLPALIPKFVKVLNSGEISVAHHMAAENETYRPLEIKMHNIENTANVWWEIRDHCRDSYHEHVLGKLPLSNCASGIVMYTFNDKKFPSTFSFLTAGGIIGLYTTFVLLASRVLKSLIAGQNRRIMFEDLPYVDRVLQLCLDIYLVREALEFALEEDLFAKLIFLYRSPETMIKWTRPKEDLNDDETDSESVRSQFSRRQEHSS